LAGIYIHIPFCKQACHYCDFHFSTSRGLTDRLIASIGKELEMRQAFLGDELVNTIYFGGGTPSLIPADQIAHLLEEVYQRFSVESSAEITLEANPDDLNQEYAKALLNVGINRLSIGVQSFDPQVLEWMNRAHNPQQAGQSVEIARTVGFENISIDLIYAIPLPGYQPEQDLELALRLNPPHISAYNLTIEPSTVFGHRFQKGQLQEVSDDTAAAHFQLVMNELRAAGYRHYEISNFAKPGKESRHNLGYWNGDCYLGFGPSAHSYDGVSRSFNIANNNRYLRAVGEGILPLQREELTAVQHINETIMLGLRTTEGVPLVIEFAELSYNMLQMIPDQLEILVANNFAYIYQDRLVLTDKGKLLADSITERLMIAD